MRIVLATDFSSQAELARSLLASLRLPDDTQIMLVHAIEPIPDVTGFAPVTILSFDESTEREVRAELEKIARTLAAPGRRVEHVVGFGRASDLIVDQAEGLGADLIVVGSRGRGGLATTLLGSVSAEVIDRSPCPVLIARRPGLKRVVLADDGSANAAATARLLTEPALRGVSVRVVSVVDVHFPAYVSMEDPNAAAALAAWEESLPEIRDAHEQIARARVDALTAAGIAATFEVREGDAAAEIVAAAQEQSADCVATGTRGRTGITRLLLGSVARGVLVHAPCSVLVTRLPVPAATSPGHDGAKTLAAAPAQV